MSKLPDQDDTKLTNGLISRFSPLYAFCKMKGSSIFDQSYSLPHMYGKLFYYLLGNLDILFIYKISYQVYKISNIYQISYILY